MTMKYRQLVWGVLLSLSITVSDANADDRTRCEILTVQASNNGTGVSQELSQFADLFKKEPFSAFNSFDLIDRQVVDLELTVPKALNLPENIKGSLNLNGRIGKQIDLTLTLTRKNKSPITIRGHASPGSPLIAAGMTSPRGRWVFGVICAKETGTVTF
jgi:hypothetical protein